MTDPSTPAVVSVADSSSDSSASSQGTRDRAQVPLGGTQHSHEPATPVLEFWPELGAGPLWDARGLAVAPAALGLPAELGERLAAFTAAFADERLPIDGPGDPAYLAQGAQLLREVRTALAGRFEVVVPEPWWPAAE